MMNKFLRSLSLCLLLPVFAAQSAAQQPARDKAPSLSSDGVLVSRTSREAAWKRYVPEGFGLALELPGEPYERLYPIPETLKSKILDDKVLDYFDDDVSVNMGHFVLNERVDLKWLAEQTKGSLQTKSHSYERQCKKWTVVQKGDRYLLSASCLSYGHESEVQGLVVGSGEQAWLIYIQTYREKPEGAVKRSRIFESVTVNK